ncbi:MAG: hypothetical protein JWN42_1773 [Candidatus Angelobacter sp.]|nr:hypothetical protein [Candidatus Angelobacter sp.]
MRPGTILWPSMAAYGRSIPKRGTDQKNLLLAFFPLLHAPRPNRPSIHRRRPHRTG